MDTKIINGKELAQNIRSSLRAEIEKYNYHPKLAIIMVGEDPASLIYVKGKEKAAQEVGIETQIFSFSENVTKEDLFTLIQKLNSDSSINGIIVQLPLPKHINADEIIGLIDSAKDVDGFGSRQKWLLENNESQALVSATPKGIIKMIETTGKSFSGKNAVVVGRSHIVGRPVATMLLNRNCTVTVAHSHTVNLGNITKQADILIVACGCANLIKQDMVKEGAVVIDVGINRIDGHLCGDVDFANVQEVAGNISPVPGGVGPMTIAMLLENTLIAYKNQQCLNS